MGKCPSRRNCTRVDRELLIAHGVPSERLEHHYGFEKMRFEHCMCDGKGTIPDQWLNCAKYKPKEKSDDPPPKHLRKQLLFIKVSVIIGSIAGLVFLVLGSSWFYSKENQTIVSIISPLIGLALPSLLPVLKWTWKTAKKIVSFFGGDEDDLGCFGILVAAVIVYFSYAFIVVFGIPMAHR